MDETNEYEEEPVEEFQESYFQDDFDWFGEPFEW